MKIHKKLGLGLGLFILSVLLPLFVFSQKTLAAPVSDATFKNAQFQISSRCGTDSNKLDTVRVNIGGKEYAFVDKDPCDNTKNLKFYGSTSFLCNQSNAPPDYGITVTGPAKLFPGGGSTYDAKIKLIYWTNTDEPCKDGQSNQLLESTGVTLYYNVTNIPASPNSSGNIDQGGSEGNSCAANFNSGFEWIMCPAFNIADSAAGAFNGFIEDQLCINTGTSSSTGGVVCGGKSILGDQSHPQVKKAWSIFRVLATSLLVIIMLVMIISQAIGGGPFDAYSVRKMLPKLVIAAIAIQLSWYVLKWAIDISNDLGRGVGDLMFAPFGGSAHMNLDTLIGANLGTHTTGTNDTFAFFAVLAGGIGIAALSIPGLLLIALCVVLALLTAFIVLVLRELLILMLVLLAPIALILWILPGTQKYWKLWSDNFSKMLLMFPMIIGLIAAGRIFAYITAGSPSATIFSPHLAIAHLGPLPVPYFGSVTAFIDLAIIIAAYFGPYFLIPQTYKWGGTAMGAIGKGVKSGMEKGAKPAKDYLDWRKGLSPWKQARAARRAEVERRSKAGFAEGLASGGLRGRYRRARLGGVGLRDTEAELRGRIVQSAEAEVEKNRREDIQRATIQLMQRDLPQFHPNDHDRIRQAIIRGDRLDNVHLANEAVEDAHGNPIAGTHVFDGSEYANSHSNGQRAALDRGVVHGHWREIEEYRNRVMASGDQEQITELQDFLQSNAPAIGDQMTHMLKGMDIAARSRPENIVKMRQEEVESIVGTLSTRAAAGDATAAEQLSVFVRNYATAASDSRLSTQLDQGGARAMKAFAENNPAMLEAINRDPAHGGRDGRARYGLPLVEGGAVVPLAATSPEVSAATRRLSDSIDEDGVVRSITSTSGTAPPPPPAPPATGGTTWRPTGGSSTPTP